MTAPRIMLADGKPALRGSIRSLLEADGFEICAEAADADAAVEIARRYRPELCLIESTLPGGGTRAVAEIVSNVASTSIVVMGASREPDDLFEAIRAGAVGYLPAGMNPARLPATLRGVLDGEAAIPRTMTASLVRELQSGGGRRQLIGRNGPVEITRREWDVIDLMRRGLSTAEIAERLFVAPVTVRRHASSVVRKLGASDRLDALAILAAGGIQTSRRRTA